ncbi:MAG: type VI secretion system contractile sheath domain-containing protein, partial [Tepidisphaerales bacterium]
AQLGSILHNPVFQRCESAWRGVQMLVSRLNLDDTLKLFLLDASRDELVADLAREDIAQSALYKLLVEQTVHTSGAQRWAAIAVDEFFGPSRDDAALLARLGTIAEHAGAAIVTGATADVVGCPGLGAAADPDRWTLPVDRNWWAKLRGMPVARRIAIAWPRILMRLPYGKSNENTEIGFEEGEGRLPHEQYLWGNPAYACLYALGQNFLENGWAMQAGGFVEIDDLPMHSFSEHGEKQVQSPAEAYLTDRATARIAAEGITPVIAIKNRNAARFAGFSSMAQPSAALAGPWA